MRCRVPAALLCALAMVVPAAPAGAQDAVRGAALLGEARQAVGGEERLRAVTSLQAEGDFKRMAGQTTIEGELELRIDMPDKFRRDEDLSPPGGGPAIIRTEVLNGSEVWEENTGGNAFRFGGRGGFGGRGPGGRDDGTGAEIGRGDGRGDGRGQGRGPLDPEQLRQLQRRARQTDLARFLVALLLTTDGPVSWVGTAESPDGTADVLELSVNGTPTRLFLDQQTHLPLMLTWQGAAPQIAIRRGGARGGDQQPPGPAEAAQPRPQRPQAATLRMTLGEYKTVDGLRLPHFITRGVNDATNEEWTVSRYRINPSFRSDTFTR